VLVALMWIIPDTRISQAIAGRGAAHAEAEAAETAREGDETAREARRRARAMDDAVNEGD